MADIFAKVVLNAPGLDNMIYTYLVPTSLQGNICIGKRVKVPFSKRYLEGYVLELVEQSDYAVEKLRQIDSFMDSKPFFYENGAKLIVWLCDTYHCTYGEALRCLLPAGVKKEEEKILELCWSEEEFNAKHSTLRPEELEILQIILEEGGRIQLSSLHQRLPKEGISQLIAALNKKKVLRISNTLTRDKIGPKYEKEVVLILNDEGIKQYFKNNGRAKRQKELILFLKENGGRASWEALRNLFQNASGVLNVLLEKKVIALHNKEQRRDSLPAVAPYPRPTHLTDEQKKVISLISPSLTGKGGNFLLHGVTGSGKTEVYLRIIEEIGDSGRGVIILVPEIALTPQMVERFVGRFGERVALLHSALSLGERFDQWRKIRDGQADIVIGARSAIFAPLKSVGLIIIDEEHENTYKQDRSPYYQAQEVAFQRAKIDKGVVVLGSATPSLQTYYRCMLGEITLLEMKKRVDGLALPSVTLVDMREEMKNNNRSIFCRLLQEKMAHRLAKGEQIMLFLNRRGYASFVLCRSCGLVIKCPHCDVSLTYHSQISKLLCHYCGYAEGMPKACPSCKSPYIRHFGVGTEKVEAEVRRLFPQAQTVRMDTDTTRKKGAYEKILSQFKEGLADILIGTQVISKGHDFPNVTLVGAVNADTAMNIADFRAGERTFQLITQVAGRAGRSFKGGEVIVQTYFPEHYALLAASRHSYEEFYQKEISIRRRLFYPPFSEIIRVLLSGREEKLVMHATNSIMSETNSEFSKFADHGLQIFGPAPAPISRINDYYRWQFFIKVNKDIALKEILDIIEKKFDALPQKKSIRLIWEINPNSLL